MWTVRACRRGASALAVLSTVLVLGCGAPEPDTGSAGPPPPAPSVPAEPSPPGETAPEEPVPSESPVAPPEPTAAPDERPVECRTAELTVTLGTGDAGAGTVYRPLRFTNSSERTCDIRGYPGVSYVTGNAGKQVGEAAFRLGHKGSAVALSPGEAAVAPVGFVQVRNYDPADCRPTPVRGLRVYPPHETESVFVPMSGTGCRGAVPGHQLTVRTVEAGR